MTVLAWVQALAGPTATVAAAGAALRITWVFNSRQLKIAKAQLEIADSQRKIAAAKHSFDLYDKRFKVFEAARTLLVAVFQQGDVQHTQLNAFHLGVADAMFLFDEDIEKYLKDLSNRVTNLRILKLQTDAAIGNEEKFSQLVDKSGDHFLKLAEELPILTAKFKPYLKLGNV